MKAKLFISVWIIYLFLAFPMFYFVYKYGTPDLGLKDFFDYYKLYNNWNFSEVDAPFNMRLVSTFLVYLFNKIGLHYDTAIAFDSSGLSKQVFFNAIFFNYLCIISTCTVIFMTVKKHIGKTIVSFSSGLLYLLGFGTLFYEFMPLTDAFSILIFAIIFYNYLAKNYYIIIFMLLLVLQREYVFLVMGLVALLDYWKKREKYYLHILFLSVICFAIYFILRKTMFYTPKYDHQASPLYFLESVFQIKFQILPYIKQTLMTLNIFIIYLIVVAYKKLKKLPIDTFSFLKLLILFIQINIISFAAVLGNNTGRYFYILIPMVIFYLTQETKALLDKADE